MVNTENATLVFAPETDTPEWRINNTPLPETVRVTDIQLQHDRLTLTWICPSQHLSRLRRLSQNEGELEKVDYTDGVWTTFDRSDDGNVFTLSPPRELVPTFLSSDYLVNSYDERVSDSSGNRIRVQIDFTRQEPREISNDDSSTVGYGTAPYGDNYGSDDVTYSDWYFNLSEGGLQPNTLRVADNTGQDTYDIEMWLGRVESRVFIESLRYLDASAEISVPDGDDFIKDNSRDESNTVEIIPPSDASDSLEEGDYIATDMRLTNERPYRYRATMTVRRKR